MNFIKKHIDSIESIDNSANKINILMNLYKITQDSTSYFVNTLSILTSFNEYQC